MSIISGHWEGCEEEEWGGMWIDVDKQKVQHKRVKTAEETVGVYFNVIGDCRCPNGYQKGSHNKHKGNQTVEITTHSEHCIKQGAFSI